MTARIRFFRLLVLLATAAVIGAGNPAVCFAQEGDAAAGAAGGEVLTATLERLGNFYYAGDPVQVRVAVFNTGEEPLETGSGLDLYKGLTLGTETGAPAPKKKAAPSGSGRFRPAALAGGGFFGRIIDLRDVYEGLDQPGRYSIRLQLDQVQSPPVLISIIPKYDPSVAYRALLETEYGTVSFDLLGGQAPKHVKNFYELANQGYYDGSFIVSVMKGVQMIGGDRAGDGTSTPGFDIPLEIHRDMKHSRGTLSMLRKRNTDHGSQFVISLGDNPGFDGQLSIFGVISGGEEALAALEALPTSGRSAHPMYKPLSPVKILSVKAEPAPEGSRATAETAEVRESAGSL